MYIHCTFCLQTGASSFLTIETKEEKPNSDDGDSNSDSDVDEGVNKCNIFHHNKNALYNGIKN